MSALNQHLEGVVLPKLYFALRSEYPDLEFKVFEEPSGPEESSDRDHFFVCLKARHPKAPEVIWTCRGCFSKVLIEHSRVPVTTMIETHFFGALSRSEEFKKWRAP